MSKPVAGRSVSPFTVEHGAQVLRLDDPKGANRGERLGLGAVQLMPSLPVSHDLAVHATRQVDMAAKDAAAVIVGEICAIAAATRPLE